MMDGKKIQYYPNENKKIENVEESFDNVLKENNKPLLSALITTCRQNPLSGNPSL